MSLNPRPWADIARYSRLPWPVIERQQERVYQDTLKRENARFTAAGDIADIGALRPLHPGMSDVEVREIARRRAEMMAGKLHALGGSAAAFIAAVNEIIAGLEARPFVGKAWLSNIAGVVGRVMCVDWWTRQLKRAVVQLRERQGRASGEVCARRHQPYLTHDTVRRLLNRDAQARAMLEATELESEDGEVITLAQAADAGTANLSIRRGELMTRIKGCEEWADIHEWEGLFSGNTAPSRFHAVTHEGKINPKWIAAGKPTPKDGQAWLCKTWAACRAALARRGISVFGVRVAEPHQDGTPHWHLMVWCKPGLWAAVVSLMEEYWLKDEGDEPGARKYRFNAKVMEAGGAAGYVSKYISKGIDDAGAVAYEGHIDDLPDGRRLVMDQGELFGGGATRVRMWARAHGIRQFQALGQPPVTVWRELRRVDQAELPDGADVLRECWDACNRDGERRANWLVYMWRQGGACIGRDYRVRIVADEVERVGRYETSVKAVPLGVVDTQGGEDAVALSSRKEWRPKGGWGSRASSRADMTGTASVGTGAVKGHAQQGDTVRSGEGSLRAAVHPWTRVNNCTRVNVESLSSGRGSELKGDDEHGKADLRSGQDPGRHRQPC